MPHSATLQITLSDEELQFVREQVASGEFSSESDLLSSGLERIRDEYSERKQWEQEVFIPRIARMWAEGEQGIPIEQVIENLAERRRQRQEAR